MMSNISQHYLSIIEGDDYKFGWRSAERGEPRPDWKPIPGQHEERLQHQQIGWDDYHAEQRRP